MLKKNHRRRKLKRKLKHMTIIIKMKATAKRIYRIFTFAVRHHRDPALIKAQGEREHSFIAIERSK